MQNKILNILLLITFVYIFTGCSAKDNEEYNKPAIYWYNKMIKQISNYQIDEADDTFTSLESEHRNSPLLPSAIMIIATTHMEDEEYAMANYYFDEYLKRFSLKKNADYIRYLKIKSNFLAFKSQFREQELLNKTIKQTDEFIKKYPKSEFIYLVQTIKSRLSMTKSVFDKEIASLYGRVDKPKAQKYYTKKAEQNWEKIEEIEDIDVPWYRYMFE
ncbi:MAG: outer membrane protein assembly factor BamD [Campylobacterota bacterium]|nr:outer membrane protein assembly factor BamD [Campylobacterota bacterium]